MNWQVNVDRVLDGWLAEGPSQLPDRTVDRIVQGIEHIDQRGHWWLPGRKQMNRMMLAMGGIAGLVLLIAGGGLLYLGLPRGGGLQPGATPTPVPTPTVVPATVSPFDFTIVKPGPYVTRANGLDYTFSVPTGWLSAGGGTLIFQGTNYDRFSEDFGAGVPDFAAVSLPSWWGSADSASVFTDPCHKSSTALATGTSAADLAAAIQQIAPMNPTAPDDISISGYSGKHIRVQVPADAVFTQCDEGMYWSLSGRFAQGPGQVDEYWILDLPGGNRQVFGISYMPDVTQEVRDQLHEMVQSMAIQPATPA